MVGDGNSSGNGNGSSDSKTQTKKHGAPSNNNNGDRKKRTKAMNNNAPGSDPNQSAAPTPSANNGGGRKRQPPQKQQTEKSNDGGPGVKNPPPPVDPKLKKQNKKMGKRAKQLESMSKKANAEDDFFRQCQREAAKSKEQPDGKEQMAREMRLFGKQGAQGINFAKYDAIQVDVKPGAVQSSNNNKNNEATNSVASIKFSDFDELKLLPTMRRNIKLMNYAKSTPIQRHAIPLALAGHDLMCCAQTGSGKTCAFLLPVCASLASQNNGNPTKKSNNNDSNAYQPVQPKCIVLAPTRELASQIELEAEKLCFNNPGLQPVAVYGGASQRKQLRDLAFAGNESAAIVVATPGRLTDFVGRNLVSLQAVQYLILDEADRMLDMGFEPQIRKLVLRSGMTPKTQRQTFMFSATFPDKIQLLASEFLRSSYTWIAVGRVGSTTDSITQVLQEATADNRHKLQLVVQAVKAGPKGRTLIFVQKKRTATWLKKMLSKGGPEDWDHNFDPIEAVEIHGDRSQSQREAALSKFRSGDCLILVATDVAARGLDIDGVEHVINMDLPVAADDFDSYVHRIGRTGRAGHTGLATSFYVPGDTPKVGNRKIAAKLIQQLKESKQQVPSFLEAECANGGGSNGAKERFGGTDVRNSGGGRGGRRNKIPQKNSSMQ
jgi:ATP-dependent RNA helicase DDX3X